MSGEGQHAVDIALGRPMGDAAACEGPVLQERKHSGHGAEQDELIKRKARKLMG